MLNTVPLNYLWNVGVVVPSGQPWRWYREHACICMLWIGSRIIYDIMMFEGHRCSENRCCAAESGKPCQFAAVHIKKPSNVHPIPLNCIPEKMARKSMASYKSPSVNIKASLLHLLPTKIRLWQLPQLMWTNGDSQQAMIIRATFWILERYRWLLDGSLTSLQHIEATGF
jgi:hypothetical protein